MLHLDHIAVSGQTRDAAAAHVGTLLGVDLTPGGSHALFGTHNHLLGLAKALYLEAIAIDPEAQPPGVPRWFGLDDFDGPPRLTTWICRTDNLETLVRDLPEAGRIVSLERGALKWRMAVPEDGRLPFDGCFPALMQWDCDDHPGDALPESGWALDVLTIIHPDCARLQQRLAPYFDDHRVHFEDGSPHLTARFSGPGGEKTLR